MESDAVDFVAADSDIAAAAAASDDDAAQYNLYSA